MTGALHVTVLAVLVGCAAAAVVPETKTPVAAVPAAPIPTGAPAAPAVPAEPAVAKTAPLVEAPTPPAPSVASKKDADVADKKIAAMKAAPEAQLMAASSSSGAIGVAGVGPGETCKENGDCKLPNSYCKSTGKGDGSCHCQKDFVFSSDGKRCLQAATAEKRVCEEARQCVQLLQSPAAPAGGAACVEGQCRCRYDYEPVNGTCVLKKARGKACSSEAECVDLENGACIQGVCGCKDDFVPAVAANKCLSVLHALEEVCEEDLQCSEGLGDLGRCSAGKCACADGASLSNDKKCVCGQDEEFNKVSTRCEKLTPGKQQAVKEVQQGKGGASSFQSSMTTVVALISSWTLSVLVL